MVLFTFLFIKERNITGYKKDIKQHNIFKTDNKSAYEFFLEDHVTLKTGVMTAENSVLCHRNKL